MKRLSHVAFAHPIPIPGTHLRQQEFGEHDGWSIEDDDGRITLQRGDVRFYTYVSASCVEAAEPEPVALAATPATVQSVGEVVRKVFSQEYFDEHQREMEKQNAAIAALAEPKVGKRKR